MFNSWKVTTIPSGQAGTEATLYKMRELVAAAQLVPITRATVLSLLNQTRPLSTDDGVEWLRRWVRRNVSLINEPVELLQPPDWLLGEIQKGPPAPWGDCDDVTMLAAALFVAAGLPTRLTAVRPPGGGDFVHVFPEVSIGGQWSVADPSSDRIPPDDWDFLSVEV